MKFSLLALCSIFLLSACAGMRVTHTDVATGASKPRAIYIRPFDVRYAVYRDPRNPNSQEIRKSLAPIEFANILQEELAKMAPAMVLAPDEFPLTGWLVEGEFEVVDAGDPGLRGTPDGQFGAGRSYLKLHVRVIEVDRTDVEVTDAKDGVAVTRSVATRKGRVIYAFDVEGGSRGTGRFGSISAPGFGNAIPFDFRNAAERILLALTPDPFRYGYRSSPVQRN